MKEEKCSSKFKMGHSAQERALPYVPDCYVVQSQEPPMSGPDIANIPVIDLGPLRQDAGGRANVVKEIGDACCGIGFFHIINQGICQLTIDKALESAFDFFKLPAREKLKFMANNVFEPVRYGTSLKVGEDKVQFWRNFLKHYAHPLSEWIDLWPTNPPHYSAINVTSNRYNVTTQLLWKD